MVCIGLCCEREDFKLFKLNHLWEVRLIDEHYLLWYYLRKGGDV